MIALAEMQEMGSINLKLPTQGKEAGKEREKSHLSAWPANDGTCQHRLLARGEAISCNHTENNLLDLEEGWSGEMGWATNTATYLCCYPPPAWLFATICRS